MTASAGFFLRMHQMGFELPEPPPALAAYAPAVFSGELIHVCGHGPYRDGSFRPLGKLGGELSVPDGVEAARASVLSLAATLHQLDVDLDAVRVLKMQVFVNSTADFVEQHRVADGASELLVALLGQERGRHPRTAVGVPALPLDICLEIDVLFSRS
jgi:enamine deaminase RidA (YjgF/YER057c/UK114 family)